MHVLMLTYTHNSEVLCVLCVERCGLTPTNTCIQRLPLTVWSLKQCWHSPFRILQQTSWCPLQRRTPRPSSRWQLASSNHSSGVEQCRSNVVQGREGGGADVYKKEHVRTAGSFMLVHLNIFALWLSYIKDWGCRKPHVPNLYDQRCEWRNQMIKPGEAISHSWCGMHNAP